MHPFAQLSPKELARHVLDNLPDEASIEDVMESLLVVHEIQVGLRQVGQGIPQAEVEAEFKKRRDKRSWR
ncbi:MAG: hypothetical protein IH855_10730 [Bacteroidetes bacterium]|nr:hypothetical protein [Bacteroidota bacterium]